MNGTPMTRFGEALVVFEGPGRISWRAAEHGEWAPDGIWPEQTLRTLLAEHIDSGSPLLVVLDEARDTVPVLREEWDRAPYSVRAALTGAHTLARTGTDGAAEAAGTARTRRGTELAASGTPCAEFGRCAEHGEIIEVRVPFLDWLPEPVRARAAAFLAESDETLARTPTALLPPLLLEEPRPQHQQAAPQVRFARRLLPGALTPARLSAAVRHIFGDRTAQYEGPTARYSGAAVAC
ncbi:hypothetical protein AB0I49_33090 [Streptomyces sp. NPDC050617]|uniref:hypothetical protein n=1 Tax=Streptomyces sp. NPDC050617 TaxID=3154628 RepID=UPI00341FFEB6